jgi:hypothetical protein
MSIADEEMEFDPPDELDICPHGFGFDEECEICDDEEELIEELGLDYITGDFDDEDDED